MRILNFGSCCIDNVYRVPAFVRPGETLPATDYQVFPGGKGLNQSLAAARAGASVSHAGVIGHDGGWLRDLLANDGVDVSHLRQAKDAATGHAVIQVNDEGENAIIINAGTNRQQVAGDIGTVLDGFGAGDLLLLQNEINLTPEIMTAAKQRELTIAFNAAPMTDEVLTFPLHLVDYFIVNEVEAAALAAVSSVVAEDLPGTLRNRYPGARVVLTLGERGAVFDDGETLVRQPGIRVSAVDTTGAGDTFTGYFAAGLAAGQDMADIMATACRAAAISVTRAGAATAIPWKQEVDSDR